MASVIVVDEGVDDDDGVVLVVFADRGRLVDECSPSSAMTCAESNTIATSNPFLKTIQLLVSRSNSICKKGSIP